MTWTMENTTFPIQPPMMGQYPQFALLDMIIPGFSVVSSVLQAHLGIDLTLYLPLLVLISGSTWAWSYFHSYCSSLVSEYLMSSIRIRTDDEIFNMVMAWVTQQKFAKNSRNIMANTNVNSRSWTMWRFFESDDQNDEEDESDDDPWSRKKKTKRDVQYTPSYGSHFFWFKGRPLFFDRIDNRDTGTSLMVSEKEEIQLTCFGRDPAILKMLLLEAREIYHERDECKTLIYRGTTGNANTSAEPEWKRCMARSTRPFSTVILEEKTKNDLIADIADYLNPATRRWYANRGIPYRRGYLLHGPPGTGKSSLSLALAGYFNMRIYILSLSSPMASEETVSGLFAALPRKCVVLLEDIDSAGLTHTRDAKNNDSTDSNSSTEESKSNGSTTTPPVGKLSLSGLLNILDGVASQEGRVLIMTTNHIEKLDKALIRPGRVDMTVHFGRADKKMASAIFRSIYAPHEGEDIPVYDDRVADPTDEKAANREEALERIQELSHDFAAKLPSEEFSPAEIQGLLLRHKRHPLAALDAVDEWIVQTRKEKKAEEEKQKKETEEKKKKEEEEKKKEEEEKKKKEEEEKKTKEEEEKKKKEEEEKAEKKKKKEKKKKEEEEEEDDDDDSDSDSDEEEDEKKKKKRKKAEAKKRKEKKARGLKKTKEDAATETKTPSDKEPESEKAANEAGEKEKEKKTPKEGSDSGYITP